jgi:hypothetical protein
MIRAKSLIRDFDTHIRGGDLSEKSADEEKSQNSEACSHDYNYSRPTPNMPTYPAIAMLEDHPSVEAPDPSIRLATPISRVILFPCSGSASHICSQSLSS